MFLSGNGVIPTRRVQVLEDFAPRIHKDPFGSPVASTTVRFSHPIPFLLPPLNPSPERDYTAAVYLAYRVQSLDS